MQIKYNCGTKFNENKNCDRILQNIINLRKSMLSILNKIKLVNSFI